MINTRDLKGVAADAFNIFRTLARSRVMWALVFIALGFLGLHVAMTGFSVMDTAPSSANWARIDRDHSASETWELMLLSGAAVILTAAAAISRRSGALPLAVILAFLAADNSLQFHERFAGVLVPGKQNYGEMLFFVLLFLASATLTLWSWIKAMQRERSFIVALWCGIILLGGFGAGVDAVHVFASRWLVQAERFVGIVEDFGELVSISILAAISWSFLTETIAARRGQRETEGWTTHTSSNISALRSASR